jgi:hypothetical protein
MEESMLSKSVKGLSSSDLVGSFGGISDRYVYDLSFIMLGMQSKRFLLFLF